MGVLNIICSNGSAFSVRMARGLAVSQLRLVRYYVKTAGSQDYITVDVDWISGNTNVLNAVSGTQHEDHRLVLPMAGGSGHTSSMGDGVAIEPANNIVPATFSVRTYDKAGAPLAIQELVLVFSHEGARAI
jgi:hypothetical protein